jgi:HK97 family phage major capsid protein
MPQMTQDDLKKFVAEQTLPLIKDTCGALIADVVREQVEKAVAAGRANPLAAALDGSKTTETAKREPGFAFARAVRALACAKMEMSNPGAVMKRWGGSDDIIAEFVGAQEKALAAGSASAGGFLVPEQYSAEIIPLRRAMTVVRSSGPRTVPLPTGTLNLPKITAGASGSYIGENVNAPKSQQTLGNVKLTTKKLAVLVPVSNDLVRMANPAADGMVRDDIVRALAVTEDLAFLRGDGTNGSPKGIRYWAPTANISASAGTTLANISTDLGQAMVTLMNGNIPQINWRWIFAPRTYKALFTVQNTNGFYVFQNEMAINKTLWGYPFSVTTNVPITLTLGANSDTSEVALVNFDDMTIGDNLTLTIDVSQDAAYNDGSGVVPAFQADQTVIRAIAEHDFAARDANAIAIINGVRWS